LLLRAIYPRVKQAGLRYDDLATERAQPMALRRWIGLTAVVVGTLGGFVVGNLLSTGRIEIAALATHPPGPRAAQVGVGLAPFIALVFFGALML